MTERTFKDRIWRYSRKDWNPRWWHKFGVPQWNDASDEYGWDCIVWGTLFTGYVVFAWKPCFCADCVDLRTVIHVRETFGDDMAEQVERRLDQVRMREVSGEGTRRA